MAVRRWILRSAVLIAALLALTVAPGPAQADGALPEGDFVATYAGRLSGNMGPSYTGAVKLELTCRSGSCTYVEVTAPRKVRSAPVPQAPSLSRRSTRVVDAFPAPEDWKVRCPEAAAPPTFTTVFAADGERATIRTTAPALRVTSKGGGVCAYGSYTVRFRGGLSDLQLSPVDAISGEDEAGDSAGPGADGSRADADTPSGRAQDSSTASRLDSGSAGAPSVLSALPTVEDASLGAGRGLALALLVLILVLLIAFPTHLLNSAVEAGHEKLSAFRRRRLGLPPDATDAPPVSSLRTWAIAAGVVLAASLISAFVDPEFGLNPGSARVIASLGLALAIETLLVWSLVIAVTRRASPGTIAGFHAAPATLVVVVLAVVLTRLTGFEPGIIFGLVAGVTFAATASTPGQGKVALAGTGLALTLALTGWIGYSLLGPATTDAGFARTFLTETLSSLAIAGIASLPLALIPLRGLTGHTLYTWNKPLWAATYATGLIGFFLVLMPMPFSWAAIDTPLRTWVLLYLAYATTAVIAWAALTQPWRKDTAAPAV